VSATIAEMLAVVSEARRPRPTLYVVEPLTPDGAVYQMGRIAVGPASLADGMEAAGIEVLREGGTSNQRSAVLRRHGSEAHAGFDLRIGIGGAS
jgi:hypothetical protein